ncbi:MAG: YcnI family protein [Shinella sp.]|nr:YcnI family protein [Shinella sp.]
MAHLTFENAAVAAGKTAKFVLRVPHGCDGSPTVAVRIAVPKELEGIKPQPKPGWKLSIVANDLHQAGAAASHSHGDAADVKELVWSGGRLEDAFYDEFVFRASVAKTATGHIFVPVVQQCESGVERWIEIPATGASSDGLRYPAPSVSVEP